MTGAVELHLPARLPYDAEALIAFLGARAIPGVESFDGRGYRRTLALDGGPATVELTPQADGVRCRLELEDPADEDAAVASCRRLLDLDADPGPMEGRLGGDPVLGSLVKLRPGLRVPSTVDGFELAVRAIVGQQISVAGARTVLGRIADELGEPLSGSHGLTRRFPTASALAGADPARFPFPRARGETLCSLAGLVLEGGLDLDSGGRAPELLEIRGVGPWTASYVAMRALGDQDAWLPGDVGLRNALQRLGHSADAAASASLAEGWRPWRSYAVIHLWATL